MESHHVHSVGVDAKGNINPSLSQDRGVDKYVLVGEPKR
jgi:hypothetical protein